MNKPRNNVKKEPEQRLLPFFIDFVKFAAGFAIIIALALITLKFASAAMG